MEHSYKHIEEEHTPLWDAVRRSIISAENNGDLVMQTTYEYVVGPIVVEILKELGDDVLTL